MKVSFSYANYQFWLFAIGGGLLALAYGRVWDRARPTTAGDQLAVEIDPGYALGQYNIGVALQAAGDASGARARYAAAEAADPTDHTPCADHAQVALQLGKLDEALAEARCAVDHDDDAGAEHVLGRVLAARGDTAGAAAALARAGDGAAAQLDLGVAEIALGDRAAAGSAFRAAIAGDPALADAWFDLGLLAMQAEDTDDARADLVVAVTLAPTMIKGLRNLAALEALAGRRGSALMWLDRAIALEPGDAGLVTLRDELLR
jgi:tetratricopeptide (TPR) repeat protein|nr:tetratricopeptide repeat protein [Kofleriaceae bacterium]